MLHFQDIRHAFRRLRRAPGFALLTVLVLAGGLGLSTFTFSFLYTAMIRPLPLADGERIVRIDPMVQGRMSPVDAADVAGLRASLRSMRQTAAFSGRELVIGRDGDRRVLDATVSEPVLFDIARVAPMLGRTLRAGDAEDGAEPVVVLGHRVWRTTFGGDSALLGRHVALDGVNTRVVGIMPEGFGFPVASQAWIPLPARTLATSTPGLVSVRLVGRLAPDVSRQAAASEATVLLQRTLAARDSSVRADAIVMAVESFPAAQIGEERTLVFTVLNLMAGLILLLALVNVTNLLVARANERVRETAVRLALGASTGRLVMQGMWETIIVCVAGGALGTAGAAWGLDAITRWTGANLADNLAFWWVWRIDAVTVLVAGLFVTVAIAALGSVVSLRTTRMNVREVLQDGSARTGSRREGRLSRRLVVVQVATVTVLMFLAVMGAVVAGRVMRMDPGFSTSRLLQGGVELPPARYATAESRARAFREVAERLAEQPELEGTVLRRTLAEHGTPEGAFATRDSRGMGVPPTAHVLAVLGDLRTIGSAVIEGRGLEPGDDDARAPVALVSRSLARRLWPGRSAVGEQIRLTGVGDTSVYRTIVGVTADVPQGNPLSRDRTPDAILVPLAGSDAENSAFLVRHRTSEAAARAALLAAFAAVDPLLVPDTVQPFAETLRKMALIALSVSKLFAACFAFALLLALVGTYGIMSRSIGARGREIGVRRALGATDGMVTRLLLAQGGRQVGVGALVAAPVMAVAGVGVRHFFPVSGWLAAGAGFAVAAAIVALVLLATWAPVRGVLRIGVQEALRQE